MSNLTKLMIFVGVLACLSAVAASFAYFQMGNVFLGILWAFIAVIWPINVRLFIQIDRNLKIVQERLEKIGG